MAALRERDLSGGDEKESIEQGSEGERRHGGNNFVVFREPRGRKWVRWGQREQQGLDSIGLYTEAVLLHGIMDGLKLETMY